jgi:hypothetical protein
MIVSQIGDRKLTRLEQLVSAADYTRTPPQVPYLLLGARGHVRRVALGPRILGH